MSEALEMEPQCAWIHCEKAWLEQEKDDLDSALSAVDRALELRPYYRVAVGIKVDILQLLNRDAEAVTLLREANVRLESGRLTSTLAGLLTELRQYEEALVWWEKTWEYYPLAEARYRAWLHGEMSDAYYNLGQLGLARDHAEKAGPGFFAGIAERLEGKTAAVNVTLGVPFVRQNYLTCAPAILSVLSQYWDVPVDHAELASEICYEGTFDYVERHWANEKGFFSREFTVTWEVACQLIDHGVPFALNTVETTSAHLQAVIGYDLIRETLLLREPSKRTTQEVGRKFIDGYLPFGPRGMLMIPKAEVHRLDGIDLPEAEQYDAMHRLSQALDRHDRPAAVVEYEWLQQCHPVSRLTYCAQRDLAAYDGNVAAELEATEGLLRLYPDCGRYLWRKAQLLDRSGSQQEIYLQLVKNLASQEGAEIVFLQRWGYELGRDARKAREARRYLLLALRARPTSGDNLADLASSLWDERSFEEATELYRLAACQVGCGERYGKSYFLAARHVRKTNEALEFLQHRFERFGKASSAPARALFYALSRLDRGREALELLEKVVVLRPDDGDFLLYAVDEFARENRMEKAEKLLKQAESKTSRVAWLRTNAEVAGYRCDYDVSLRIWREVLEKEPLAMDAHRRIAAQLGETQGQKEVVRFLSERLLLFPHYEPLLELWIEWSKSDPPEASEEVIRRAIALNPNNGWAIRELALNLVRQRRLGEALEAAAESVSLEPKSSVAHQIYSYVLNVGEQRAAAIREARLAIEYSVDNGNAIRALFQACATFEERKDSVAFIQQELGRQVIFGDGVSAFREEAYNILEPEALLTVLREAHAARPDLWQTWIAMVEQLVDMQNFDEALSVAMGAVDHFPLLPRCWFELAEVHRRRLDSEGEIKALLQAIFLNPAWSKASRGLADAYERKGDFDQASLVVDQAIAMSPMEGINFGYRGDLQWLTGKKEEAIASLQQAVRLDPAYGWAWSRLEDWSEELGQQNAGYDVALELTQTRPGESRSWMRLADCLGTDRLEEKLDALGRAIELNPKESDLHDRRALALAHAHRYDEAEEACRPAVLEGQFYYQLQGRHAWIKANRGEEKEAIQLMRKVLDNRPDYYWGWSRLTDWLTNQEEYAMALDAARNLERIAPRSVIPQGYIGDLLRKLGRREEAREALHRAFAIDPSYDYAGYELFDEQIEANLLKDAGETLDRLKLYHSGCRTLGKELRLAVHRNRKKEALGYLREICFCPSRSSRVIDEAIADLQKTCWKRSVQKILKDTLADQAVNLRVAHHWVEGASKRFLWPLGFRFGDVLAETPQGQAVRREILEAAVKVKSKRLVRQVIRKDGDVLRNEPASWGKVSYATTTLELYREGIEFMRDWREQSELEMWMLFNLTICLRSSGNFLLAREVCALAITLPKDNTATRLEILAAWDEAVNGQVEDARIRLEKISHEELSDYFKVVRSLASSLVSVLGKEAREHEYETQRLLLTQEIWKSHFDDDMLQGMGRLTVRKLAEFTGKRRYRLGHLFPKHLRSVRAILMWFFLSFGCIQILRGCLEALSP